MPGDDTAYDATSTYKPTMLAGPVVRGSKTDNADAPGTVNWDVPTLLLPHMYGSGSICPLALRMSDAMPEAELGSAARRHGPGPLQGLDDEAVAQADHAGGPQTPATGVSLLH
eukprot:239646-Rhodomonas_salina.1